MPSSAHEIPIALFRAEPSCVAAILRDLCRVELPRGFTARVVESAFTEIVPAAWSADLVIELRGATETIHVIVEMQRSADADKRYSWPHYAYSLAARHRCRVCLLVFSDDDAVARWAVGPIETVLGVAFRPLVVGPSQVPRIRTAAEAVWSPELAVLSVMAHDTEPDGAAIIEATLEGLAAIDDDRSRLYTDWLMVASDVVRGILEEQMKIEKYVYPMSDFARHHYGKGMSEGVLEGEARGKAEGEARGKAEGEARGKAEGEARGKAEAVLAVLAARGMTISDVARGRILACRDIAELDRLLVEAVRCADADGLTVGGPASEPSST